MSTASVTDLLGDLWHEIAPPIELALRRRGVGADDAAEISQEVAERALRTDEPFASAEHLLRWGHVVAGRIAVDRYRKQRRLVIGSVPDAAAPDTVEEHVIAAETSDRLRRAVASLSPTDRAALFDANDAPDSSAIRVRRHRARAKIARLLALVAAAGGLVGRLLRRLRDSAMPIAVTVPILLGLSWTWLPSTGGEDDREPGRAHGVERPLTAPVSTPALRAVPASEVARAPAAPAPVPVPELPALDVGVTTPDGNESGVRAYAEPVVRPTFCVFDLAVVGDYCTPL